MVAVGQHLEKQWLEAVPTLDAPKLDLRELRETPDGCPKRTIKQEQQWLIY